MKKYLVVTPPFDRVGNFNPSEYGSDVVLVEATGKRKAIVLGLRELRRTRSKWLRDHEGNPFNGLKVEEVED